MNEKPPSRGLTRSLPLNRLAGFALAASLLVALPARLSAQPWLLDQPPTQASSGVSDLDCSFCQNGSQVIAEDLVLGEAGWIAEIELRGGYVDDVVYDDSFSVRIFADDAGAPDPPALATRVGIVPAVREATGLTVPFNGSPVDEYRFLLRLPSPPPLAAGTYWIEIADDSSGQTGELVWGYGTVDPVAGRDGAALSVSGAVWFPTPADFNLRIPTALFVDGFESGDTIAWSAVQP